MRTSSVSYAHGVSVSAELAKPMGNPMPKNGKRKRRRSPRLLLSWSMRDQSRFIEAVERLHALVNDLEKVLAPILRQALMARPARAIGPDRDGRPYV